MAITNATTLADYAAGISTQNATLKVDSGNKRVGVGTTNPQSTLQVGTGITMDGFAGVITAQSYYGDGSALTGVASTDNIITSTASTFTGGVNISGASNINISGATTITGAAGAYLLNVSGISTVGVLTVHDTTQSTSTSTGGLVVYGGVGIAKNLHVGGNATIAGVLTYEDVTNQDVLGLSTFRSGVQFGLAGVGGTIDGVGNAILSGITTVGTGLTLAANVRAKFGNDGDLAIYHNGSNSFVVDNGTGPLYIRGNNAVLNSHEYRMFLTHNAKKLMKLFNNIKSYFPTDGDETEKDMEDATNNVLFQRQLFE